jgi:hypothetical protein
MNFTGEFLNLVDIYHIYKVLWTTIIAGIMIIIYGPQSLTRSAKEKPLKQEKNEVNR